MVTIIDYGIGNLRSIEKAFEAVGARTLRTDRPDEIAHAERVVLPGVGAFGACIDEIRSRGLERPILDFVATGKPFLGVCVGMQLLFDVGEEMGEHRGLGILPGRVVRFTGTLVSEATSCLVDAGEQGTVDFKPGKSLKVPHMGWNRVEVSRPTPLLEGLPDGSFFYFVHSFHAAPWNEDDVVATTVYGNRFPSIVARNNVFGVQFHPEKSQQNGLHILQNFSQLPPV